MTQPPNKHTTWIDASSVPQPLLTSRFVLEPLGEEYAEMDFEAIMSCRVRLRQELQWGDWPTDDFTVQLNRQDLRRHRDEFERGEAFAYTVLSPDRVKYLGCIYIERCTEIDGAQLAFWVVDEAVDMEAILVSDAIQWIHTAWCLSRVLIPLRRQNTRCIAFADKWGLVQTALFRDGPLSNHLCFLSDEVEQ